MGNGASVQPNFGEHPHQVNEQQQQQNEYDHPLRTIKQKKSLKNSKIIHVKEQEKSERDDNENEIENENIDKVIMMDNNHNYSHSNDSQDNNYHHHGNNHRYTNAQVGTTTTTTTTTKARQSASNAGLVSLEDTTKLPSRGSRNPSTIIINEDQIEPIRTKYNDSENEDVSERSEFPTATSNSPKKTRATGGSSIISQSQSNSHNKKTDSAGISTARSTSTNISTGQVSKQSASVAPTVESDEEDDLSPLEILFQFLPYYGKGQAKNDSTVRATLSNLSISDIDAKDAYGNTLLLLACQYRCEDLVRIILNKGADSNALNNSGVSGLHFACYRDSSSISIAKALLQAGANPEIREYTYGCTPLHYSAGCGDMETCKLLITYGAQLLSYDYYNYTAVDYAREAGVMPLVMFLTQMAERSNHQNGYYGSNNNNHNANQGNGAIATDSPDWVGYMDTASGSRYYTNIKTGESLWEADYFARVQQQQQQNQQQQQQALTSKTTNVTDEATPLKYSLSNTKPSSPLLLVDTSPTGFQKKESTHKLPLSDSKGTMNSASFASSPGLGKELNHTTSFILTPSSHMKTLNELKQKYETEIENQRKEYQQQVSEQQGQIARITSELESLNKVKHKLEMEKQDLTSKLDKSSLSTSGHSDGESLRMIEQKIAQLETENTTIKASNATLLQELSYKQEKLQSLEASLSKLTVGQEESIAKDKAMAEERANIAKEKEMSHATAVRELEEKLKKLESKMRNDQTESVLTWETKEKELKQSITKLERDHESEISILTSDLSQLKSKYAQEHSLLESELDNQKKKAADCSKRAEIAEEESRTLQAEVEEARILKQQVIQLHKDLQREQVARKRLHNEIEDLKGKIRVYVRIRPLSKSEIERGCDETVIKDGKVSVMLKGLGGPDSKKFYEFDQVFGGENNSQVDVFRDSKHLMMSVVDGYNVCIFAYGQTGAGKSFTMIGGADVGSCLHENGEFDEVAGIAPRSVCELFRLLKEREAQVSYEMEVQMFQLYRDNLEDLLYDRKNKKTFNESPPDLKIVLAEHSSTGLVQVEGAVTITAMTPQEVMKIFARGSAQRTTASTRMNEESSRSHLIFCLVIKLTNRRTNTQSVGKLTLVDLAGSERIDKSGAVGDTLKEAQSINKSLSALGDVISSLTTGQTHIPYRNHPLTMLMSDSIGGNAKTLMFVNTSPADYNVQESNNALSFASRCKDITNNAANPAVQQQQLNALKKELNRLKKAGGSNGPTTGVATKSGLNRPV